MILLKRVFFVFIFLWSIINSAQEIRPSEVRNLKINSQYAEIGVKFLQNNKVLFASSKKNRIGKKRDRRNNRHLGLRLYTGNILEDGTIVNIKTFNTQENNPIHEVNITFTSDFKTVYFTRNNYILDDYAKNFRKDTIDYQILKIFKASINNTGELSNITPLPINSTSYSVTNPQLSLDNKKLYFISNMKSSYGGFDIYKIDIYSDGTYSEPKNLGNKINSNKDEMFPFIDDDNILYFSSNGHGGLGELDIFSLSLNKRVTQNPINLGEPINSTEDDFAFIFNKSINIGYISSTRRKGVGNVDIYTFYLNPSEDNILVIEEESIVEVSIDSAFLKENAISKKVDTIVIIKDAIDKIITDSITPPAIVTVELKKVEECVQIVEGYILNTKNAILDNATVTLYENGRNIGTYDLSPDGKYHFELKCNRHYRVTARLNKFEESYFEIRTTRFTGSKTITNITLDKIPCDVLIAGQLRDLNTNRSISGVKIYLIQNNSQVDATQTNSTGKYFFNVECDENYKIVTDKYGYEEGFFDVKISSKHNTTVSLNSLLVPIECSQIVRGRINDTATNVPIANATIDLQNEKGEIVESAKSNSNGNFHFTIKCDQNYTLNVTTAGFISEKYNFKSTDINGQNHRFDFALTPDICLQTITGTIINSRTKDEMTNVTVTLLQNSIVLESITTDTLGTFKFDVECNSSYIISATIKDYSIDSKTITTNDNHGGKIDISIILETKLDFEMVRDQLMIITKQIDFDLNKSNIRDDAAVELNKIITIMARNPEIKVNIGVHTDSRGPDNYSLILSEQRAQSIMEFLISRGIDANRLSGKGYGETQLLNKCSNGVPCTETEHLVNRRIEFIVTK